MDVLRTILSWAGATVCFWRLIPPRPHLKNPRVLNSYPLVSLIVPARNEEQNLPRLLSSLQKLDYPALEMIVVDDQSTDQTLTVATSFGVKVIQGAPLPEGWNGKNWACHQAALEAKGTYLLFTDADTEHQPDSLKKAVIAYEANKWTLMSALPSHRAVSAWEKLLGPFQALILVATNIYRPSPRRLFAVGQYLLFSRQAYDAQGGHQRIAPLYPDDLCLANACLESGGSYGIFTQSPLFNVRLYATVLEWLSGWRRNFLTGIQQSRPSAFIETFLVVATLLAWGRPFDFLTAIPLLAVLVLITVRQKKWGEFSVWGVCFWFVGVIAYCTVSLLALVDYINGNKLKWKGREYAQWRELNESQ